jgi:plasmid maintenance system antidote protein VapI
LTFDLLVRAWKKLRKGRIDDLRRSAPNLTSLDKVFIRKIAEDDESITVEFAGLDTAALNQSRIAEIARVIEIWLQKVSERVQKVRNTSAVLTLRLSKKLRVGHVDLTRFQKQEKMSTPIQTEGKYEHVDPTRLTKIIVERGN